MGHLSIYHVNIDMELVMAAVLVFLLVTCLLQRRRRVDMKPLIILTVSTLLLLMCQVVEWRLMVAGGSQLAGGMPALRTWKVLAYTLDYVFGYYSSVAFFYYVCEHIRGLYEEKGRPYPKTKWNWLRFLLIWGAFASVIYGICMTQDWFFFVQADGNETFHRITYSAIYLMAMVATAATVAVLIRHRKILGRLNFILLLLYKVSPAVLQIPDLLHSTCLSYLMRAFYTFVLFVHVDQRREKELVEREAQLAVQEQELEELRTQIMLSQIQPHFLYNTLSTIGALCSMDKAREAEDVLNKFALYFRQNMEALSKERYIPFEKELEHIKTYLWIEKVRFEDDLNVEYRIGPTNFRLPYLSLQPLVENAVKHGICRKEDGGTVTVETRETEEEFLVIISDDGAGFDPSALPANDKNHVGIENTKARLELLCHGKLEIRSKVGEGTTVTVHLPKENEAV